jgi:hypothetical protein
MTSGQTRVGKENRYIHLLVMLVAFFLFFPFVRNIKAEFALIATLFFLAIVLTLRAIELKRSIYILCAAMGGVGLVVGFFAFFSPLKDLKQALIALSLSIYALFMIISIILMIQKMFSTTKVTGDVIRGGISVYFLLGFLWTLFYVIIYHFDPNAFFISHPWHDSFLFYFSFSTLTTLGYGDISPANKAAMVLANLEAIVGQLYLAIFVARLVGLHVMHHSQVKEGQ